MNKYTKEDIEAVKKLFFRTELRPNEDVVDNSVQSICTETKLSVATVDKIINLEIINLNHEEKY